MESYAGLVPEALKALSPEERHNVYKPLKLRANLSANDTLELSGALDRGVAAVSKKEAAPRAGVRDSFPLTSRAFDAEEASPRGGRNPKARTQSTSRANGNACLTRGPRRKGPICAASSWRYVGVTY